MENEPNRPIFTAEGVSITSLEIVGPNARVALADVLSVSPDKNLFGGVVLDVSDSLGDQHRFKFKDKTNAKAFLRALASVKGSITIAKGWLAW